MSFPDLTETEKRINELSTKIHEISKDYTPTEIIASMERIRFLLIKSYLTAQKW